MATRAGERGAAAVEFALVAPMLLMLVFGIISYSYMLSFRQAISQAAAEGARAAAVAPPSLTDEEIVARARAAVNDGLGSYGVSCTADGKLVRAGAQAGTCTISSPQSCTSAVATATCVKVSLDYTYREDSLLPSVPGVGLVLPERLAYATEVQVS